MSYTTIFSNGRVPNMVKKFVVDTKANISEIDISQILPGSKTYVIEENQWYMLKNDYKTWAPVEMGGSGDSGGSEDGDHTYYNGGSEDENLTPTDNTYYNGGSEDDG